MPYGHLLNCFLQSHHIHKKKLRMIVCDLTAWISIKFLNVFPFIPLLWRKFVVQNLRVSHRTWMAAVLLSLFLLKSIIAFQTVTFVSFLLLSNCQHSVEVDSFHALSLMIEVVFFVGQRWYWGCENLMWLRELWDDFL